MAPLLKKKPTEDGETELGGQMSFLEHLDELRKRLIRSILFIIVASFVCWHFSAPIYNFLARPVHKALAEAQSRIVPMGGMTGNERIASNDSLKEGDTGRYVFGESIKLGTTTVPPGTSVVARVAKDTQGQIGLFTDEALYAGNTVIPKGLRLPFDFTARPTSLPDVNDKLVVTTA